jgi:MFS family permease
MRRGTKVLILVCVLLVIGGIGAVIIWQAEAHHIPILLVTGVLLVVLGAGSEAMHLTVSDEYLRTHFPEPLATQFREQWRRGWVGVLLGALTIAAAYFLGGK